MKSFHAERILKSIFLSLCLVILRTTNNVKVKFVDSRLEFLPHSLKRKFLYNKKNMWHEELRKEPFKKERKIYFIAFQLQNYAPTTAIMHHHHHGYYAINGIVPNK